MSKGNKLQQSRSASDMAQGPLTESSGGLGCATPLLMYSFTERWLAPWIVLAAHRCSSLSFLLLPFLFSTSLILQERTRRHRHTCPQTRTAGSLLSQVWKTKLQQMVVLVPEQRGSTVPSPWSHTHTHTFTLTLTLSLSCLSLFSLSLCLCYVYQEYDPIWKCYCPAFWFTESSGTFYTRTYTLPCYLNEDTSRHLLFLCNN